MTFSRETDGMHGADLKWWIGTVEDVNDPLQMNRVRVRIWGLHSHILDEMPVDVLPWASVMLPTTEPGMNGTVHGLLLNSWVIGFFMDGPNSQNPIVIGTVATFGDEPPPTWPTDIAANRTSILGGAITAIIGSIENLFVSDKPDATGTSGNASQENKYGFTIPTSRPFPTEEIKANSTQPLQNIEVDKLNFVDNWFISKDNFDNQENPPENTSLGWMNQVETTYSIHTEDDPNSNAQIAVAFENLNSVNWTSRNYYEMNSREQALIDSWYENLTGYPETRGTTQTYTTNGGNLSSSAGVSELWWSEVEPKIDAFFKGEIFDREGLKVTEGFGDPSDGVNKKVHPLYPAESEVNRLARNDITVNQPGGQAYYDEQNRDTLLKQSTVPYNPQYPYNKVTFTESGHIVELDDTPDYERIRIKHKSGTGHEIGFDGTQVVTVKNSNYEVVHNNKEVRVRGSCIVYIDGDSEVRVGGNLHTVVRGDYHLEVAGNIFMDTGRNFHVRATQNFVTEAGENWMTRVNQNLYLQSVDNLYIDSSADVRIQEQAAHSASIPDITQHPNWVDVPEDRFYLHNDHESKTPEQVQRGMEQGAIRSHEYTKDMPYSIRPSQSDIDIAAPGTTASGFNPKDPEYLAYLRRLEQREGLPYGLLYGVMMTESNGNPNATSHVGAKGLFQFMPGTAKDYGIAGKERDPIASADAASRYLGKWLRKFRDLDKAIASYNAGPGNVINGRWRSFPETVKYVPKVKKNMALAPDVNEDLVAVSATPPGKTAAPAEGDIPDMPQPDEPANEVPVNRNPPVIASGDCGGITASNVDYNMKLSPHFSIRDLTLKPIKSQYKLRNQVGLTVGEIVCNLRYLANTVIEPLYEKYGSNLTITSVFRHGVEKSQHFRGEAIDFQLKNARKNEYYSHAQWIRANLPHDQFLLEYKTSGTCLPWLHVSIKRSGKMRYQTLTFMNGKPYGTPGLHNLA